MGGVHRSTQPPRAPTRWGARVVGGRVVGRSYFSAGVFLAGDYLVRFLFWPG